MIDLHGFGDQLLFGTLMTIRVAAGALVLGLILGLLGAAAKLSNSRIARGMAGFYTTVIRGLPELLVVLIIYFGSSSILTSIARQFSDAKFVELSPYMSGVIALGLTFGAYATEVFRGAFLAIPAGQGEAARALGMHSWQVFRLVTLPQLWRIALPGLGNLFLVLLKDTSLVSIIGIEELMRQTKIAVGFTKEPFTFYFTAAIIYLLLTIITMRVLHKAEIRANRGIERSHS
ncbi:MAG: ABC transporter permease [Rhodospirillaceae bacterium]|nr:ABC transporter permease [Rhodospirillaceae bacterium]